MFDVSSYHIQFKPLNPFRQHQIIEIALPGHTSYELQPINIAFLEHITLFLKWNYTRHQGQSMSLMRLKLGFSFIMHIRDLLFRVLLKRGLFKQELDVMQRRAQM